MKETPVLKMSWDDLRSLYGIEIDEFDGTVFDPVENKTFKGLIEWDLYVKEQEKDDMYGQFTKMGGGYEYEELY
jgi:hypothetical protein